LRFFLTSKVYSKVEEMLEARSKNQDARGETIITLEVFEPLRFPKAKRCLKEEPKGEKRETRAKSQDSRTKK
jgi:hypothetical protein